MQLNTNRDRAEIKLVLSALEDRALARAPWLVQAVRAVVRDWWADPFMKWAFGLMFVALALANYGMPAAPYITGHLGPLVGAVVYVLLMGSPGFLCGLSLRFGWESVRYRLARWQ